MNEELKKLEDEKHFKINKLKTEFETKKREGLNKIKDEYNKLCQQVNLDAKALM